MDAGRLVFPPGKYVGSNPVNLRCKTGLRARQGSITPFPPDIYCSNRLRHPRFAQTINTASDFTIQGIAVTGSYFGTATQFYDGFQGKPWPLQYLWRWIVN